MAIYQDTLRTEGALLWISGQTPQQATGTSSEIAVQIRVVLQKIQQQMETAKVPITQLARLTVYLINREDVSVFRKEYQAIFGEHQLVMTLVLVSGFIDSTFQVEIDAVVALEPLRRNLE